MASIGKTTFEIEFSTVVCDCVGRLDAAFDNLGEEMSTTISIKTTARVKPTVNAVTIPVGKVFRRAIDDDESVFFLRTRGGCVRFDASCDDSVVYSNEEMGSHLYNFHRCTLVDGSLSLTLNEAK